jgi:hypothetical protein
MRETQILHCLSVTFSVLNVTVSKEVVQIHTAYLANRLEKFRYESEGPIQQLLLEDGGAGIQSAHSVRTRSNVSAIRRTAAFTR